MISRKTTKVLAETYKSQFVTSKKYFTAGTKRTQKFLEKEKLYDFLYINDYDEKFLNLIYKLNRYGKHNQIKRLIMKLHTGEIITLIAEDYNLKDRKKLGQLYIRNLAEDLINNKNQFSNEIKEKINKLMNNLELDGYIYKDGVLYSTDESILNEEEEQNYLISLADDINLPEINLIEHHMNLAEQDYMDNKWSNSISNSRNFLESIMRQIAEQIHFDKHGSEAGKSTYEKSSVVRNFLKEENIIDSKEKKAVAKLYGLLSNTGSHPYIAGKHQARLMRNLSLTISQFILLRYQGYLKD